MTPSWRLLLLCVWSLAVALHAWTIEITEPPELRGPVSQRGFPAHYGPPPPIGGIEADAVVAVPYDGCSPLVNDVRGKVVLIKRGTCLFFTKSVYASQAMAAAVIVVDSEPHTASIMWIEPDDPLFYSITAITFNIPKNDGAVILSKLEQGVPVKVFFGGGDAIYPPDRQVLADIWDTLAGPTWYSVLGWNVSNPASDPCRDRWIGVTCNRHGRVDVIELSDNDLSGSLPASLGALADLEVLSISGNSISGTLPPELAQLHRLVVFDASGSELGVLPAWIGLPSLRDLALRNCGLTGDVPANIFREGSHISSLDLSANRLTGQTPHFRNLSLLREVNLSNNRFSTLGDFMDLPLLTAITLDFNEATNYPLLSNLPSLLSFLARHNQIVLDAPPSLSFPNSIQELRLDNNLLTSFIPDISRASGLKHLSFGHNQLSIPCDTFWFLLPTPSALVEVDVSHNQLSGDCADLNPEAWFPELSQVDLSSNRIGGDLPLGFSDVHTLTELDFSNNNFTGIISNAWEGVNLKFLDFSGNPGLSAYAETDYANEDYYGELHVFPSWVVVSSEFRITSVDAPYVCPILSGLRPNMIVRIDPTYYNYQSCVCSRGFIGFPPHCTPPPQKVIVTRPSGVVTDGKATGRLQTGQDTKWLINPSNNTRYIVLKFTSFNVASDGDFVNIHVGSDIFAPRIASLRGTELPDDVLVLGNQVLIHFSTKLSDSGQQFSALFESSNTSCPPGYIWDEVLGACRVILQCSPGEFYDRLSSTCVRCSPGFFSSVTDASECTLCEVGHFQREHGATACEACLPGEFQDRKGSHSCQKCPPLSYSESYASVSCDKCPAHSSNFIVPVLAKRLGDVFQLGDVTLDSMADCLCEEGFFGSSATQCIPCPEGARCCRCDNQTTDGFCTTCLGGTEEPVPLPGYMRVEKDGLFWNVPCHISRACLGGPLSLCATGFTGNRCGACQLSAMTFFPLRGDCLECGDESVVWILNFILLLLSIIVCLLFIEITCQDPTRASSLVMLIRFLANLAILQAIHVDWPPIVENLLNVLRVVNFQTQVFRTRCLLDSTSDYTEFLLPIMLPGFAFAAFFAVFVVVSAVRRLAFPADEVRERAKSLARMHTSHTFELAQDVASPYTQTAAWFELVPSDGMAMSTARSKRIERFLHFGPFVGGVVFLMAPQDRVQIFLIAWFKFLLAAYPFLCEELLAFFGCTELPDGSYFLQHYPALDCYSDDWHAWAPIVAVFLICYCATIPIVLCIFVWKVKRREDMARQDDSRFFLYCSVFSGVKIDSFGYRVFDTLFVFFQFLVVNSVSNVWAQISLMMIAIMVHATITSLTAPYRDRTLNVLIVSGDFVLMALVLLALMTHSSTLTEYLDALSGVVFALIMVESLAHCAVLFKQLVDMINAKRQIVPVSTSPCSPGQSFASRRFSSPKSPSGDLHKTPTLHLKMSEKFKTGFKKNTATVACDVETQTSDSDFAALATGLLPEQQASDSDLAAHTRTLHERAGSHTGTLHEECDAVHELRSTDSPLFLPNASDAHHQQRHHHGDKAPTGTEPPPTRTSATSTNTSTHRALPLARIDTELLDLAPPPPPPTEE